MENIKLNGVSVGEVDGVVKVGNRPLTTRNFNIHTTGEMKFINFISPVRYRGHKRSKVITACSNTGCNFNVISNKVLRGGGGIMPPLNIVKLDELTFIKFEIYQTAVMLWVSCNLEEWEPIGPILKGLSVGTLGVVKEDDKILLWFSSYENHEELNYKEAWLVRHASLDIEKIKEVMYNK